MTEAQQLSAAKRQRRKSSLVCCVREVREALDLSREDVATTLGISLGTMLNVENGTDIVLSTALRMATFFGKPVEELWKIKLEGDCNS